MSNNCSWLSWMIKNSICVICWTVLAIVFNKWWIALFAALFMSSLETKHKYYRLCDKCGRQSPYADSQNEAIKMAEKSGWIRKRVGDEWEDYCPECQKKYGIRD